MRSNGSHEVPGPRKKAPEQKARGHGEQGPRDEPAARDEVGRSKEKACHNEPDSGLERAPEEGLLSNPAGQCEKDALPKRKGTDQAPESLGEKLTRGGAAGELPGEDDDKRSGAKAGCEVPPKPHAALRRARGGVKQGLTLDPHPPHNGHGEYGSIEEERHADPSRTRGPLSCGRVGALRQGRRHRSGGFIHRPCLVDTRLGASVVSGGRR